MSRIPCMDMDPVFMFCYAHRLEEGGYDRPDEGGFATRACLSKTAQRPGEGFARLESNRDRTRSRRATRRFAHASSRGTGAAQARRPDLLHHARIFTAPVVIA